MKSSSLEQRIEKIEKRNTRVEQDKNWETSWTRKVSISTLTYVSVVVYLLVIKNDSPYINALVPVMGFLLSTLVLPQVRKIWEKNKK